MAPTYQTSLALAVSSVSSSFGTGVTYTATATNALAGTKVTFLAGTAYLGEATLNASGVATMENVRLPVGNYTITANLAMTDLTEASSASISQQVIKATPTMNLTDITVDYDGNLHGVDDRVYGVDGQNIAQATITYTLGGSPVTTPRNAGVYLVTASFPGGDSYEPVSITRTITINKRAVTFAMQPVIADFNGQQHPVTAQVYAFDGSSLGLATVTYTGGSAVVPAGSAPIHGGTYTATASYEGSANFAAGTATTSVRIDRVSPTVTFPAVSKTYDGSALAAVSIVSGINGVSLGSAPITYTYNGSSVGTPVEGGVYISTATFTGNDDYMPDSASSTVTIFQATPTITGTPVTATYNGQQHSASFTARGINNEILEPVLISYSSGSTPVNAGSYSAEGNFPGNRNYVAVKTTSTVTINQAEVSINLTGLSQTYDGNDHSVSAKVLGIGGVELADAVISYSSIAVPKNAGSYTATASFTGDVNYLPKSVSATIAIAKATPTILVEAVSKSYNAQQVLIDGKVFGVGGAEIADAIVEYPGGSAPVNAGVYPVTLRFNGDTNYTSASVNSTITIAKSMATLAFANLTKTYDGQAFIATCDVTAADGLTSLGTATITYDAGAAPTLAGSYLLTANFAGDANHTAAMQRGMVVINRATPTFVLPNSVTYDGTPKEAVVSVLGAGGASLGQATVTYQSLGAPALAGSYIITAGYGGDENYLSLTQTATFTINRQVPTIPLSALNVTFTGQVHGMSAQVLNAAGQSIGTATIAYTDAAGEPVSQIINPGVYTVKASLPGSDNYADIEASTTITVTKATPQIGLRDFAFIYNGAARSASARVTGLGGVDLGEATIAYSQNGLPMTSPTAVGEYVVTASYTGNSNYLAATATSVLVISDIVAPNRTAPTLSLSNKTIEFSGESYAVIVDAIAPDGANLGPADITYRKDGVVVDIPYEVGTYSVSAYFEESFFSLSASATATLTITPANPSIFLTDLEHNYDGSVKTPIARVTGINNSEVADAVITWAGGSAPVNPGAYQFTASFAGNTNYNSVSVTGSITINRQTPLIDLQPINTPYTGVRIPASAKVYASDGFTELGAARIIYNTADGLAPQEPGYYTVIAVYDGSGSYAPTSVESSIVIYDDNPQGGLIAPYYSFRQFPQSITVSPRLHRQLCLVRAVK
jgi:hypothetical protein